MTIEQVKQELKKFDDFKFYKDGHYYEYKGEKVGISVTRFIEQYANEFDKMGVAEKCAIRDNKTVEEILEEWEYKNKFACSKGSNCHIYAQSVWTDEEYYLESFDGTQHFKDTCLKIFEQADRFHLDFKGIYEHIQDEQIVGSYEYDISSAVDHLFYNKLTGEVDLIDYKTNSDIRKNEKYAKNMKVPLQKLKDTTLNHYFIQLSIYKFLIEKYTNIKIANLIIVYMSENIENYEIIEVPYLKKEVEKILENRRKKNMNSIPILIMGNSGTGKSSSLRNLPADETAIINVTSKPMPFKNKNGIKIVNCNNYEQMISAIIKTNKRIIVIDDSSYMMTFENFDKATNKGYDKFTTMAVNYYNLITTPLKCDGEKIIYFITHEEIDENGVSHPKTIGKMLSQQLVIEGLFSIVLRSLNKNGEYVFQTHNDGTSVCKSPIDMFEEDFMPNDLAEIDKIIREYYEFKPITEKLVESKGE